LAGYDILSGYEPNHPRSPPSFCRHSTRRQDPRTPAPPPAHDSDCPAAGITDRLCCGPDGSAAAAWDGRNGDIPRLFTYPAAGAVSAYGGDCHSRAVHTHLVMRRRVPLEARWLAAHGVSALCWSTDWRRLHVSGADAGCVAWQSAIAGACGGPGCEARCDWDLGFSAGGTCGSTWATMHHVGKSGGEGPAGDSSPDGPDFAIISYGGLSLGLNSLVRQTSRWRPYLGQHSTKQ